MKSVVKAVKDFNDSIKVVCAGYADYFRVGAINPMKIPEIANTCGAEVAMIDTAVKDGKRLFDFLSHEHLKNFVELSHNFGLQVALAGSLRIEDIAKVHQLGADIIGFRGAVCEKNDRKGVLSEEKVKKVMEIVKRL